MAHRGCVSGVGGVASGGRGLSPVAVPLLCFLPTPPRSRASDPQSHQWSWEEGGDRRLGPGGGVGEEEGREGERQAGRALQMLPRAQSSLLPAPRGLRAQGDPLQSPGVAPGTGTLEDDVDLSVLHALGRCGSVS